MNYDQICYYNSCLSQVIIRIDFFEFVEMDKILGSDVEKEILKSFSKKGMQQMIRFQTMNVYTDPKGARAEQTTRNGIQQEFSNSDGNKVIISDKYIILEINKYNTFEKVMCNFMPIFNKLHEKYQFTSMRTGIRYINIFNEKGIKPQKNFFVPAIGALLDTKQIENHCIRSMAMNEYVVGDMRLNFRFGMYNPGYPNFLNRNDYVLDYDCYCDEAVAGIDEIIKHIRKGHDMIQERFESSITEQLRKVMRNG